MKYSNEILGIVLTLILIAIILYDRYFIKEKIKRYKNPNVPTVREAFRHDSKFCVTDGKHSYWVVPNELHRKAFIGWDTVIDDKVVYQSVNVFITDYLLRPNAKSGMSFMKFLVGTGDSTDYNSYKGSDFRMMLGSIGISHLVTYEDIE